MVTYLAIIGVICWWGLIFVPWRPWGTEEQIDADPQFINNVLLDNITVLIPARDEAPLIQQTLAALSQQGSGLRIIVIDDQSTDGTAEIVTQHGAKVISGTTPPTGWSGKLWALEQGLHEVQTSHVLLLDADIELIPGIVPTLLEKAQKENLALVSLMAELPLQRFTERMLMPEDKIRKVLKIAKEPISMETPIGDDEDSHLGDFIEDSTITQPLDSATGGSLKDATQEVLAGLTAREAKVLRMRFGIDMNTDHTLEEVGKQFDVTRERIRQIEAKALRKLRHPSRSEQLKSFLDGE